MHHATGALMRRLRDWGRSAVGVAIGLKTLLAFGFYLLLWSKVFKGRSFLH
jgi:hypothetical protein